jgi:hypothetical protein
MQEELAMLAVARQQILDQVAAATTSIVSQIAALNLNKVATNPDFFSK